MTAAFLWAVQTLQFVDGKVVESSSPAAARWHLSAGTAVRASAAAALGAAALYCLHTGQRDRNSSRLAWAVILFFAALALFL